MMSTSEPLYLDIYPHTAYSTCKSYTSEGAGIGPGGTLDSNLCIKRASWITKTEQEAGGDNGSPASYDSLRDAKLSPPASGPLPLSSDLNKVQNEGHCR